MAVCSDDRNDCCCTRVCRGTYPGFRLFMFAYTAQGQKNNVTTNWHGRYLLWVGGGWGRVCTYIIIILCTNEISLHNIIIHRRPARVPQTMLERDRSQAWSETQYHHRGLHKNNDRVYVRIRRGDICALRSSRNRRWVERTRAKRLSRHMDLRSGFNDQR